MKKYCFVHIMIPDDMKFLTHLPGMFNNPKYGLDGHEHLFVTPHKRIYDAVSENPNVEFCPVKRGDYAGLINKYGKRGDWLFVHGMSSLTNAIKIKKQFLKKIIWRTWGHDTAIVDAYLLQQGLSVKNIARKIVGYCWKKKVSQMYAIGVGNNVDVLDVKKRFDNIRTCPLSYAKEKDCEKLLKIKAIPTKKNDIPKVLLGHSGHGTDNHFSIIDRLSSYKYDKFAVYIILSYGDEEYIGRVKKYALDKLGDRVVVIDRFMSSDEYAMLLNEMDIAILDGPNSYALANVGMLLLLRKKIFLNRDGIINVAFDVEKIPHCHTDEIGRLSFDKFVEPLIFEDVEYSLQTHSFDYNLNNWKSILAELKNFER